MAYIIGPDLGSDQWNTAGQIEWYTWMRSRTACYIISIAHREFESIRFQGRPLASIIVIVIIIIIIIAHMTYFISYTYACNIVTEVRI